jgi:hypothetical protein
VAGWRCKIFVGDFFALGSHSLVRYFPDFSMAKQSMGDNAPRSLSNDQDTRICLLLD